MPSTDDHLSEIKTLWSVVQRAHGDEGPTVRCAQERMLDIYGGAVRRYLMAAIRCEDGVDEVYQEFALRFVRGDLKNVNPDRGKFRSFLKTCLYHLIVDHQRRKATRNPAEAELDQLAVVSCHVEDSVNDAAFVKSWRDDLLARAWQQLADDERTTGKPYHTILKLRAEQPELSSPQLADAATSQLGREITAANVRVLLHRSRELFAECLLTAVRNSLPENRQELIEEELIELQLLDYCRSALERKTGG